MLLRIVLLLLMPVCCLAQKATTSSNKAAQRSYELAGQLLSNGAIDRALVELRKATEADPLFTAAWQQMGDLYRRKSDYRNAASSYRKVLEIDPDFHKPTYFGLGESELNTGNYESALTHLRKYASFSGISEESKRKIAKYIADCLFSLDAIKNPVSFRPVNLGGGVNSLHDEYLPVVTADESRIIFTRKVGNNEDFFTSSRSSGDWTPAKSLSPNINTYEFNEGAQCISPDGNYLFFTGCNRPDGMGRCDIYISKREGSSWSTPFNIGRPINTPGWESQPSISADGRTIYFVSTRPGGMGGYDIWQSTLKEGGEWSEPENLGPNINTPYDEQSPFIHPDDQTLYFSSNGWPGLGNKDLFMSRRDNQNPSGTAWEKPVNLGYPINTWGEETGMTTSSNGRTAFFASNQHGGSGGLDIYSFEIPEKVRPLAVTYTKGRVFDKDTRIPLEARIQIINVRTGAIAYDDLTDTEEGVFLATLTAGNSFALHVSKDGYLFYSQNFSTANTLKPYLIEVPLKKIEIGGMVVLNNVFFESNKYDLLSESQTELNQLIGFLTENPSVRIEIGGHTDNVGDDQSNQILSQNRAKVVYDYLISHKVHPERLTFKGYGESQPIADNNSLEGRQSNRRTEFRIVGK